MNRIDHHIRISQLIALEVNFGLDENEKHELYSWINDSEENKQVYGRIRSQEGFLKWDEDFHQVNVEEGWKRFDEAVKLSRTVSVFQTILRYAAVVFISLFLAGGGYYLYNDLINQTQQHFAELESRNPQVQLILADGRKLNLDGVKGIAFKEKDGTRIENGEGNLKYQAGEEKGKSLYNTVEIPRGCQYKLVLSDGTKVHLNAMSSLRFPVQFSGKIREVELCGEAYFDVTKDVKHPFVVNVLGTRVEVMGTSFNVKAYARDEEVVTTLVEGSVKVQSSGFKAESMLLESGQQAIVDGKTGDMDRCEVDVALFTSWKEGVFLFKNQRMEDIMKELARWYGLKVFYKNSVVKEYRFGGHFDKNSDISAIMEMFELTRKVEVSSNGKTIVISEK